MQALEALVVLMHRQFFVTEAEQTAAQLRLRELVEALGPDLARQVRDTAQAYLTQTAIALGE